MRKSLFIVPIAGLFIFAPACDKSPDASAAQASAENQPADAKAEKPERKGPQLGRVEIGAAAPGFKLTDIAGKTHDLADYRGKTVVLEWFNPDCPFVVYAHDKGPLNELAKTTVSADSEVVWLAINSGAAGKEGASLEANTKAVADWGIEHPVLVDADGTVGRQYGAKTTPQMFIIDPEGKLVYQGALDNAPFGKLADPELNVYVRSGLEALQKKLAIDPAETKPYGCSVKYSA